MLMLANLRAFAVSQVQAIENIKDYYIVASDDELGVRIKDVVHEGDKCSLVVLVPSHDIIAPDEDTRRMKNNLTFMLIKKTDTKAGALAKELVFETVQKDMLQFALNVFGMAQNFGINCQFRDPQTNKIPIIPVQDYFQCNGYSIDFYTKTKF